MSISDARIHRRIEWLVQQANDALPDGYVLGYELAHTHAEDGTPLPDENCVRFINGSLTHWRRRLDKLARRNDQTNTGMSTDLVNLPGDATAQVLFELLHRPTGVRVVRCVSLAALRGIAEGNGPAEQKVSAMRAHVEALVAECERRVRMLAFG